MELNTPAAGTCTWPEVADAEKLQSGAAAEEAPHVKSLSLPVASGVPPSPGFDMWPLSTGAEGVPCEVELAKTANSTAQDPR